MKNREERLITMLHTGLFSLENLWALSFSP